MADDKEKIDAKKFIYRDKFSRNGWLNMLKERLEIAKKLLSNQGVILVSIDDNEQAYLKVLMDEIFGEENFLTNFVFAKTSGPNNNSAKAWISINHEYIVCYAKNIKNINIKLNERKEERLKQFKNQDNDPRGSWAKGYIITPTFNKENHYPVDFNGKTYYLEKNYSWSYTKDKMLEMIKENRIGAKGDKLFKKIFLNESKSGVNPISTIFDNQLNNGKDNNLDIDIFRILPELFLESFLINPQEHGSSTEGTRILSSILGTKKFLFPKSVKLLIYLINIFSLENSRILDFYAGSGTTGHAVLELNRQDGGNRSYTLVTNNENKIAKNITYERLYRINKGEGSKIKEEFDWIEKNNAFNSTLDVYDIEYKNMSIKSNKQLDDLLNEVNQMLNNFGIKNNSLTSDKILAKLRSLKAMGE
ncbi:site-specific DNA-methyltransferase [Mycoplasma sp. 1578d]|nr:site-specific DNA-methyltransferase [Mycoplasma sp. 1578d]UUM25141.1 site-specific DNA-methyltransferase [Mycoplasma sp. 3686d]